MLEHLALTKTGFQYVAAKDPEHDLSYWYYSPSATSDGVAHNDADPVVFVHGVGGLASCYQMVEEMKQATENDNVPIVCIDLPHVSLKWTGDTPKIESQVASITKILDDIPRNKGDVHSNSTRKATFVGHSYGTAVVSWMIQSHPDRVNGCIFIGERRNKGLKKNQNYHSRTKSISQLSPTFNYFRPHLFPVTPQKDTFQFSHAAGRL